ncbi:MAG: NIPSNAP family protein [Candidatus Rokuibacteriota bacterium]
MIYEIRTYQIAPGSLAEVEKRFGEGYEHRKKISPLAAFWHTEIGPLNEIIHVWPYADLAERSRLRAEAVKAGNWPPKIAEFIETMQSEILVPFPFLPDLTPGRLGPVYEMRYYTMKAGTLPDLTKRWESKITERMKMSPVALAGHVEHGEANRFIHIWAYKSLDERAAIRNKAREMGVWPPPGGSDTLLTMANKIMLPAAFSPAQ